MIIDLLELCNRINLIMNTISNCHVVCQCGGCVRSHTECKCDINIFTMVIFVAYGSRWPSNNENTTNTLIMNTNDKNICNIYIFTKLMIIVCSILLQLNLTHVIQSGTVTQREIPSQQKVIPCPARIHYLLNLPLQYTWLPFVLLVFMTG